jgi:hypothetical protein
MAKANYADSALIEWLKQTMLIQHGKSKLCITVIERHLPRVVTPYARASLA